MDPSDQATCSSCGATFTVAPSLRTRYPGWTPSRCGACHGGRQAATATPADSPTSGVFTDGSATPNPGAGGWGVVWVVDDDIVAEAAGRAADTTNNRMELTALLRAVDLVPPGTSAVLWSDSNLAVRSMNEWAVGWAARGWKRAKGPVENLDLVRPLYEALQSRPELSLRWIKAHAGHRWNEYADELASGVRRPRTLASPSED